MNTKLLYAFLCLILFSSCSLIGDNDPEPEKTYLLQRKYSKVVFPNGKGGTIDLTYTFNDDKQLTRISGVTDWLGEIRTIYTRLAYDSKGRLERINTLSGWEWVNYYNDQNQIVKQTRTYQDLRPSILMHYYDEKGRLSETKVYSGEVSEETNESNRLISYPSTNQIKVQEYIGTELSRDYTLNTDNNKRPLPVLPNLISNDFFSAELIAESIITKQNIVSSELILNKRKQGVSYNSDYNYNEAGYPITCTKTFHEGSIENITYTYSIK